MNQNINDDNYDPDNPDNYGDIDQMMEAVTGDEPESGEPYSLADEMKKDDDDR